MSGLKSLTPKTIPQLKKGRYIVGVSGGVDSIVLLDLLAQQPGVKLIIAHFDHGIREDSAQDALFVQKVAEKYDLSFVAERGDLGRHASEAEARRARYAFFNKLIIQFEADALITAHHQDDLIETARDKLIAKCGRTQSAASRYF
jgi:tRNA(Ile)-lysidine synthetase-like protein